jgi:hypothetical protein
MPNDTTTDAERRAKADRALARAAKAAKKPKRTNGNKRTGNCTQCNISLPSVAIHDHIRDMAVIYGGGSKSRLFETALREYLERNDKQGARKLRRLIQEARGRKATTTSGQPDDDSADDDLDALA